MFLQRKQERYIRGGKETTLETLNTLNSIKDVKAEVLKDMGFVPTGEQKPVFDEFFDEHKWILFSGGWRAGKSESTAALFVMTYHLDIPSPVVPRLYWIIADCYATCQQEYEKSLRYFQRLKAVEGEPSSPSSGGQWSYRLVGNVLVKTKSVEDEFKIAEEAPDGILVVEAGRLKESTWYRIMGRLLEKRAWCILSGTLETSDQKAESWYTDLFWEWQGANEFNAKSYAIPTWSNSYAFPGGRTDPIILQYERTMPADMFQEKFAAIPVKPSGLIMREFDNNVHVIKPFFNPDVPVELAIDPGYNGAYAVEAIQIIESIPYFIDEVYLQGYVTQDVISVCSQRPWWNNVTGGVVDIAAKQHQAMPAVAEIWRDGIKDEKGDQIINGVNLRSQHVEVEEGIRAFRRLLHVDPTKYNPQTGKQGCPGMFVTTNCPGMIAECGGGKSPIHGGGAWMRDINTGKIIDRNNHAIKAGAYWAVDKYGYSLGFRKQKVSVKRFYQ